MIAFSAQAVVVTNDQPEFLQSVDAGDYSGADAQGSNADNDAQQAAAEEMFREFDTTLHDDAIWSAETRAAHTAYYDSMFKDVARAMVENVNPEVAAVYFDTDVETLADPTYQFVAETLLAEYFQDEEEGVRSLEIWTETMNEINEIQTLAAEAWISEQDWPAFFK